MKNRSLVILALAGLSGLGAMMGVNRMLARGDRPAPIVETQRVVVAARDLKVEEVLKDDLLKVTSVPKSAVAPGSFTSRDELKDRWVQIKILAGEPIVDAKLGPKGSPPGLVSRIPKGIRAIAIEVNEQSGVSGFVLPDHRVDVIQAQSGGGKPGRHEAETILQDVLVLASGQTFTRAEDKSILARTVTLALTPSQVEVLVAARSRGPLSLSLRGVDDHDVVALQPPTPERKPEAEPEPPPRPVEPPPPPPRPTPPPPRPRIVVIYRGHERDSVAVGSDHREGDPDGDDADDEPVGMGGKPAPASSTVPASPSRGRAAALLPPEAVLGPAGPRAGTTPRS